MGKILIIEDDIRIASELKTVLEINGYDAMAVQQFDRYLQEIDGYQPDLILLDINLPDKSGFELCKEIRTQDKEIPIIMVTSRDHHYDELKGLVLGADDYITKPYHVPVLLARIQIALRKHLLDQDEIIITIKGVSLNIDKGELDIDGAIIDLTKTEFKLLLYLMKRSDKIISREELIDFLWDNQLYIDDNALSIHINRIRNKLKKRGIHDFVITRHGQGYII